MSRIIKFRAWDGYRMRSWDDIKTTKAFWHWLYNPPKDLILMQFTGLQDKNGVDIYEGDVVRYLDKDIDQTPAVVVYSGTSFSTECTITKDLGDMYRFRFEIIGNIHEDK